MLKWILVMPLIFLLDFIKGLTSSDFRDFYIDNLDEFNEKYIFWRKQR